MSLIWEQEDVFLSVAVVILDLMIHRDNCGSSPYLQQPRENETDQEGHLLFRLWFLTLSLPFVRYLSATCWGLPLSNLHFQGTPHASE